MTGAEYFFLCMGGVLVAAGVVFVGANWQTWFRGGSAPANATYIVEREDWHGPEIGTLFFYCGRTLTVVDAGMCCPPGKVGVLCHYINDYWEISSLFLPSRQWDGLKSAGRLQPIPAAA